MLDWLRNLSLNSAGYWSHVYQNSNIDPKLLPVCPSLLFDSANTQSSLTSNWIEHVIGQTLASAEHFDDRTDLDCIVYGVAVYRVQIYQLTYTSCLSRSYREARPLYSKMLFMSRLVNWIKPIYGLRNIPTDVIPGMMTSPDFLGLKYDIKTTYFSIKSPLSAIRIYAAIHGNSLVICVMWYCFLYFSDRIRQTGYRQAVIFCIHSLSADLPYKMWYKCNDIHAEAYICLITNACFCASFDYMYNA